MPLRFCRAWRLWVCPVRELPAAGLRVIFFFFLEPGILETLTALTLCPSLPSSLPLPPRVLLTSLCASSRVFYPAPPRPPPRPLLLLLWPLLLRPVMSRLLCWPLGSGSHPISTLLHHNNNTMRYRGTAGLLFGSSAVTPCSFQS